MFLKITHTHARLFRILTVVFLLAALLAVAFHHHEDAGEHTDCLVCQIAKVVFALALFLTLLLKSPVRQTFSRISDEDFSLSVLISNPFRRGPPLLA